MRRVIIQADDRLIERAQRRAAERGISFAQLVREALEKDLGPSRRRSLRIVGAFESGVRDNARKASRADRVPPKPWR